MTDISYFDAWQLWLDGRSTLGNDLLGMQMIWWGRGGKILSFLSGVTIVVDLVGPEKFSRYGHWIQRLLNVQVWHFPVVPFVVGGVVGVLTPSRLDTESIVANLIGWAIGVSLVLLLLRFSFLLINPQMALIIRWMSLGLFVVGFHFDLLAS
ncbi:unnamed protein product [[Actinomadura] parvosata subsp. kistnae]|uniref:Uncharacterized protein n=1 Tax=[Actinomadura] parvosata subsp. kistnae TaxID=1909395 RepID=A0A1U9ZXS2_9ACTN|nr:hypothetical protein [Nonomuraea sp. ATCC 55076]AQZ62756.1 hypothetical protein BKM31_15970 [Nonomuraea sp. ATCC 55076]SPL89461.1 unnamed protein product [Actinomadura parvosata subsp. kistnae]